MLCGVRVDVLDTNSEALPFVALHRSSSVSVQDSYACHGCDNCPFHLSVVFDS